MGFPEIKVFMGSFSRVDKKKNPSVLRLSIGRQLFEGRETLRECECVCERDIACTRERVCVCVCDSRRGGSNQREERYFEV